VPPPAPTSAAPSTSPVGSPTPAGTVGFAQPALTPTGLEVTSVFTKVKGGVSITVVAQNSSKEPITVDTNSLGPHDVAFRDLPVAVRMDRQVKKLAPGEALSYPCRVTLPDMKAGLLTFTVDGTRVSGRAQGD
jgi:hypothetical protein